MPHHIRTPTKSAAKYEDLVSRLSAELREPQNQIQPIILEDVTEQNRTLRVHVVWQEWRDVPHEVRAAAIQDAYEAVYGSERRQRITLALGFDFWEARNIGLLPYSLRPVVKDGDRISLSETYDTMRAHGAPVEYADHGPQFWFATFEDAESVKERIESALPGSKWSIVEESRSEQW